MFDRHYSVSSTKVCVRNAALRYKDAILQELGCIQFYYDEYAEGAPSIIALENDLIKVYESIINGIDQTISLCHEKMEEAYILDGNGVHAKIRSKSFMRAAVEQKSKAACSKFNSNYFADAALTLMHETTFTNAILYLNRKWTIRMDTQLCSRKFISYFKNSTGLGTLKASKAIVKTQSNHPECK